MIGSTVGLDKTPELLHNVLDLLLADVVVGYHPEFPVADRRIEFDVLREQILWQLLDVSDTLAYCEEQDVGHN